MNTVKRQKKKVCIFVRSYNDLDCRLPLILEFAKAQYKVAVIGVPLDIGYNHPEVHELFDYLVENGVHFQSVFQGEDTPFRVKAIYGFHRVLSQGLHRLKDIKPVRQSMNVLNRCFNLLIVYLMKHDNAWIDKAVTKYKNAILIFDELVLNKHRSLFVKKLLAVGGKCNNSVYAFQTGQNLYRNLWFDTKSELPKTQYTQTVKKFVVPSPNDMEIMERYFPDEDIVVGGNTRFDKSWVNKLAKGVLTPPRHERLSSFKAKYKIIFMMSKIEYGVDLSQIVDTINACCNIPEATIILKPHTRGMTLNKFRNRLSPKAIDGTVFSSSDLINWCDIVLFTGSSIIFQAMLLNKNIIHLKHCLKYKTIFDETQAVHHAASPEEVVEIINTEKTICDEKTIQHFMKTHIHGGLSSGLVNTYLRCKIETWETQ